MTLLDNLYNNLYFQNCYGRALIFCVSCLFASLRFCYSYYLFSMQTQQLHSDQLNVTRHDNVESHSFASMAHAVR